MQRRLEGPKCLVWQVLPPWSWPTGWFISMPRAQCMEAMLQGWAQQQRARFLNEEGTIKPRRAMVRRLADFTNLYPWQWQPADAEAFISHLRSPNRSRPVVMSTGRGYETTLALFMSFITDGRYGWAAECLERFGQAPQQIFHEDNRVAHVAEYEGQPGRRPLTYDEVQSLFDAADGQAEEAQARGPSSGSMTAVPEVSAAGSQLTDSMTGLLSPRKV